MVITEESISIPDISQENLIIEVEFKGYTPYMGGDFSTEHYKEIENSKVYISGYPRAKQILGRMRWLARAAVAPVTCAENFKEAEASLKVASVTIRGKDKLHLPLIPLLFGTTEASRIRNINYSWRGLISLTTEPLEPLVADNETEIVDKYFVSSEEKRRKKYNRYNSLLSRSKDKLLKPINADKIRFKASLYIDEHRLESVVTSDNIRKKLKNLAGILLLLTPTIIGLGKGVTRGFGRFYVETYRINSTKSRELEELEKVAKDLKNIPNICNNESKCRNQQRELLMKPLNIVKDIARELGINTQKCINILKIPSLDQTVVEVKMIPQKAIHEAIEAIGRASLKSSWRSIAQIGIRNTGLNISTLNIHTYPLGLPRNQKRETGYLVLKSMDDCIGCDGKKCIDTTKIDIIDIRRQSMIIAFPAFYQITPNLSNASIPIVIIMFKAKDLMRLFEDEYQLYHLGSCRIKYKEKSKSEKNQCSVIAVNVAYAALNKDKIYCNKQGGVVILEDYLSSSGAQSSRQLPGAGGGPKDREDQPKLYVLDLCDLKDYNKLLDTSLKFFIRSLISRGRFP